MSSIFEHTMEPLMMLMRRALLSSSLLLALTAAGTSHAQGPTPGYHPWAEDHVGPLQIDARDLVAHPERYQRTRIPQPDFHSLDDFKGSHPEPDPADAGRLPDGWVQRGGVVLAEPVAMGDFEVDPGVAHGMQVIPGNEYPRKHTLFLNFSGGMLYSGGDNSAENRSTLAKQGVYPTYEGGEQKALSIIQAVQEDVEAYGIVIAYLERPPAVVPYTMEMVGGSWTDTNIEDPAGGVAPGTDCGALGQRHVVYTFASGGTSATQAANTASQEAGHAWGLDHTLNCGSVMSYCGVANGVFSDTCDTFCEIQCQGPNSIGCRLTHEEFCGVDSEQQNEAAELSFLFGTNEPDVEPPVVEIVEPADGIEIEEGGNVDIRSLISDNYGGYSWYYYITQDGEVQADFVDYDRQVDLDYRPALNMAMLPAGVWEVTVGTQDHFGNTAEDSVTIFVGVPNDSGVSADSGDGTGVTGSDESGDPDTSGSQPEINDDGGEKGCVCQATDADSPPLGVASLLLLGLWARRRRRL